MKLTVLVDNNTKIDKYLLGEAGLSFYIECADKKILFDCGYSDVFLQNAYKLNIDVKNLTDIVLSHGHNDHTGGLFYLKKLYQDSRDLNIKLNIPKITAHSDVFLPKIEKNIGNVGSPLNETQLQEIFELNLTNKSIWLTDKLCFLGNIPKYYSVKSTCSEDSAMFYKSSRGLVILTGCSHSGLLNIIKYAKEISKTDEIATIIGGFHLIDKSDAELNNLVTELKNMQVRELSPCHCCDLKSKIVLSKEFLINDIGVGDVFEF